jgi:hypothetical protein
VIADNDGLGVLDLVSEGYCTESVGIMYSLECHEDCRGHEIH